MKPTPARRRIAVAGAAYCWRWADEDSATSGFRATLETLAPPVVYSGHGPFPAVAARWLRRASGRRPDRLRAVTLGSHRGDCRPSPTAAVARGRLGGASRGASPGP